MASFGELVAAIQKQAKGVPCSDRFIRKALRAAGLKGRSVGRERHYPVQKAITAYVAHVSRHKNRDSRTS
jgi:hypothetical protein